jgi:hypothetical protein
MTKEERLDRVHDEALREFGKIQSALRDERLQCLQDRRFYSLAGSQWEGPLGRQFENKPRLEVNKIHLSVIRIFNEYRNNRITVKFVSRDGSEHDALADMCADLYRADEQDSTADEAYDNAFEEAVGGGIGAWRLRTEYEDESDPEDERQRIRIEPIYDADSSVFFDLNAKRQDKSDAKYAYVMSSMSRVEFAETWGGNPASWPKIIHQYEFDWMTPDVVYIAEYYKVEEKTETLHVYRDVNGNEVRHTDEDFESDEGLANFLEATGAKEIRTKRIKQKRVHKYIMSGAKILEDCGYIAGKAIPVIPNYGKRWFVDNVERCMGHVRLAKDAQRLKNMQLSKLAEISSLSTVEKPIVMPEQIAGHQVQWAEDNLKNYPYLLLNPITDANGQIQPAGPVAYTRAPNIPPAMAALLQITEQDMKDVLGDQAQGDKIVSNIAEKTVQAIQARLDMQTYIYVSNFAKAMKRCGEVWLGMARDVYVEEGRKMKGVDDNGKARSIELARPVLGENGEVMTENDLADAKFDVVVEVGPASASKRQTVLEGLKGMMAITQDPETLQVLGSAALMNMDGEGLEDVRNFFRTRLVKMGVVKPTEEEAKQMAQAAQGQAPDPQAILMQSMAEEATAKAAQARANTVYTIARSEESRANTIETLAKVDQSAQTHAIETMQTLHGATMQAPAADQTATAQP